MKKISIFVLMFLSLFLLTACGSTKSEETEVESNGEVVDTSSMKHKKCTREATADDGIDVTLSYDLYYTGENLNILHSIEKVVSPSEDNLNEYEDAYNKIYENYKGLEYYDAKVIRGDTSVTSDLTINYDKIDVDELIAIEGEEDNIFENGKAKLDKWMSLAEKFGTTCEDVSD